MTTAHRRLHGSAFLRPTLRALGGVAIALLVLAFALLCSHQVQQAEARRTASQVRMSAFSDCLQYVVGSTIGSCVSRLGAQPVAAPQGVDNAPNALPGAPSSTGTVAAR